MIVLGFGFRQSAQIEDFCELIDAVTDLNPTHMATAMGKEAHSAFQAASQRYGLTVITVDQKALGAQQTVTQSQKSVERYATGSVSEASALAAAGPKSYLLRSRQIGTSRNVTCAVVQGANT